MCDQSVQHPARVALVLATILVLGGGLSCNGTPRLGFSKCVEDWPTADGPRPTKPSLAVDAPTLAWKTNIPWGQAFSGITEGGPVLSRSRLAFQASDWIYFLDKNGANPQQVKFNSMGDFPSGLVADTEGNIYYVAQDGVYSVDADGKLRWHGGYGAPTTGGEEFVHFRPPVLGPDGVVYAVTYSQRLFAIRTSDGSLVWSQPAPGDQYPSEVRGGAGKAVFVAMNGERTDALDTRDGSALGSLVRPQYGRSFTWDWGSWVLGWDLGIADNNVYVFDSCGLLRWSKLPQGASGVVAPGELLVVAPPGALALYDTSGTVVTGPLPAEGRPMAAGADGTIYTYVCDSILAYSLDLKELWRFDLGGGFCTTPTGGVILDDDGMMYLVRASATGGTEVIAFQTGSPGLADSSWPSWRHDNRGTAWLVPGTPAATTDDAAVTDVIDAPIDDLPGD
jgi:outer membrane protein assembly factor BamB